MFYCLACMACGHSLAINQPNISNCFFYIWVESIVEKPLLPEVVKCLEARQAGTDLPMKWHFQMVWSWELFFSDASECFVTELNFSSDHRETFWIQLLVKIFENGVVKIWIGTVRYRRYLHVTSMNGK